VGNKSSLPVVDEDASRSFTPLTRLVDEDVKARKRLSVEMYGEPDLLLPGAPFKLTETRVVVPIKS
jgi:hypothetical protein